MKEKVLIYYKTRDFAACVEENLPAETSYALINDEKTLKNRLARSTDKTVVIEGDFLDFDASELDDFIRNSHVLFYLHRKIAIKNLPPGIKRCIFPHGLRRLIQENLIHFTETENSGDKFDIASRLTGTSAAIQKIRGELVLAAEKNCPVLITGENGTGKSLAATLIHSMSPQGKKGKPLFTENAASISENLAESELFGHEEGSFTGAERTRKGIFEAADGSTLFLDEIGELNLSIQAKLLHVLQNGIIRKVGAEKPKKINVRMIYATNANLRQKIAEGKFRRDLYYRINAFEIRLPPLRERTEDIETLCAQFFEKNGENIRISPSALLKLREYSWPGNIRELENVLNRAVLKTRTKIIQPETIDFCGQDQPFF